MTNNDYNRARTWLIIGLLSGLGVSASACSHDAVDNGVDHVTNGAHRVADKMNTSLHNANNEIKELSDKLPPSEKVEAELNEVGQDVRDGVRATGQKIKHEVNEAREAVRSDSEK